jgi:hypothetical protein
MHGLESIGAALLLSSAPLTDTVTRDGLGWMFRRAQVQRLMNARNCACYNSEASIHVLKASYVYTVATTKSICIYA